MVSEFHYWTNSTQRWWLRCGPTYYTNNKEIQIDPEAWILSSRSRKFIKRRMQNGLYLEGCFLPSTQVRGKSIITCCGTYLPIITPLTTPAQKENDVLLRIYSPDYRTLTSHRNPEPPHKNVGFLCSRPLIIHVGFNLLYPLFLRFLFPLGFQAAVPLSRREVLPTEGSPTHSPPQWGTQV